MPNVVRYRLLAIDVDGTLVNSDDHLTPATCAALRRAMESGIQVVLATGRRYSHTLHLVEPLGIRAALVTASGALVKDPGRPPHAVQGRVQRFTLAVCWWLSIVRLRRLAQRRHVCRGFRFLSARRAREIATWPSTLC